MGKDEINHCWLELKNGTIIDITATQCNTTNYKFKPVELITKEENEIENHYTKIMSIKSIQDAFFKNDWPDTQSPYYFKLTNDLKKEFIAL